MLGSGVRRRLRSSRRGSLGTRSSLVSRASFVPSLFASLFVQTRNPLADSLPRRVSLPFQARSPNSSLTNPPLNASSTTIEPRKPSTTEPLSPNEEEQVVEREVVEPERRRGCSRISTVKGNDPNEPPTTTPTRETPLPRSSTTRSWEQPRFPLRLLEEDWKLDPMERRRRRRRRRERESSLERRGSRRRWRSLELRRRNRECSIFRRREPAVITVDIRTRTELPVEDTADTGTEEELFNSSTPLSTHHTPALQERCLLQLPNPNQLPNLVARNLPSSHLPRTTLPPPSSPRTTTSPPPIFTTPTTPTTTNPPPSPATATASARSHSSARTGRQPRKQGS